MTISHRLLAAVVEANHDDRGIIWPAELTPFDVHLVALNIERPDVRDAADRLFADHPTALDAPSDGLDAALAATAGYWLARAAAAPTDASSHVRGHQSWTGGQALAWLAARRGW